MSPRAASCITCFEKLHFCCKVDAMHFLKKVAVDEMKKNHCLFLKNLIKRNLFLIQIRARGAVCINQQQLHEEISASTKHLHSMFFVYLVAP